MKYIENVIIGNLLVRPSVLFAYDEDDWEQNEKDQTVYTDERFLPRIMIDCGIVPSISEVKRNRPDLVRILNKIDFEEIKWGKHKLFIAIGQ